MNYTGAQILYNIIGRIYFFIRYGKKSKEVIDKEYLGSYSAAGQTLFLQSFLLIILILSGGALLVMIGLLLKNLFTKNS